MEHTDNTQEETKKSEDGMSTRHKIYLVLILIIVGTFIYGYVWYNKTQTLLTEARQTVDKANRFDMLHSAITQEETRCRQFIAEREGDFGNFEYCQQFLKWSQNLETAQ